MSLNFANGVEFWNVKDNTPQNGSKLTDAQGNELTFGGGGGGGVTFVEMETSGRTSTLKMKAGELAEAFNSGVVFAKGSATGEEGGVTATSVWYTLIFSCVAFSDGAYTFNDINQVQYSASTPDDYPQSLA